MGKESQRRSPRHSIPNGSRPFRDRQIKKKTVTVSIYSKNSHQGSNTPNRVLSSQFGDRQSKLRVLDEQVKEVADKEAEFQQLFKHAYNQKSEKGMEGFTQVLKSLCEEKAHLRRLRNSLEASESKSVTFV